MDITKADKNLKVETKIDKEDIIWLDAAEAPFELYGAVEFNPYARIPSDIAKTVSESVEMLNKHTAGIRVRFRTNSPYIAVNAKWSKQTKMSKMTVIGMSGFDMFFRSETDGKYSYYNTFTPPSDSPEGYESVIDTTGEDPILLINPVIVETSGEQIGQEGCLSVPGKSGQVTRPNYVKVLAYDENMEQFEIEGTELLARALCHEIDHLEGHLYVEKVEGPLMDVNYDDEEDDEE